MPERINEEEKGRREAGLKTSRCLSILIPLYLCALTKETASGKKKKRLLRLLHYASLVVEHWTTPAAAWCRVELDWAPLLLGIMHTTPGPQASTPNER
jgi:hypothetical protein